jgi:hypothetical protein
MSVSYPTYARFPEVQMPTSVARLRQDIFFCSPANYLFDFPEAPRDGVFVWENPLQVIKEGAAPSVRLLSSDVEFPNDVLPAPFEWDSFLTPNKLPVVFSSGRFPIEGSTWENGQPVCCLLSVVCCLLSVVLCFVV